MEALKTLRLGLGWIVLHCFRCTVRSDNVERQSASTSTSMAVVVKDVVGDEQVIDKERISKSGDEQREPSNQPIQKQASYSEWGQLGW